MTLNQRREVYFWNMTLEVPFCINCKHFHRHYLRNGDSLECGHCVFPRSKSRKTYDTCEHFQNKHTGMIREEKF